MQSRREQHTLMYTSECFTTLWRLSIQKGYGDTE